MKTLIPLLLALLLSSCFSSDDKHNTYLGCFSSSDYREFHCVSKADFKDASGKRTSLSRTIANCTILRSSQSACTIHTLPFIASEGAPPTRKQIMSRVIVSHQWMADNFALLLDGMPDDMINLFSSVTAIVIHDEIRPAFFWPETGAIYIDPYYLWINQAQYDTISKEPDYRSDFGNDLQFVGLARYTKNGDDAFGSGNTRTIAQTKYALSAVLFHELAHARDAFPASEITAPDSSLTPKQLADSLESNKVSHQLQTTYPLQSTTLFDMADVRYKGVTPDANLLDITANDMGTLLESEGANDDYAYVSSEEDTAMLFEETMMQLHYDIDREIVYATPLNDQQANCDDFSFDWTAINRFAESGVLERATYVVNGLLPDNSHSTWLASPDANGVFTWCQSPSPRGLSAPAPETIHHHFWY